MFSIQTVTVTYPSVQERIVTPVLVQFHKKIVKVNALWDTGSNRTYISNSLADKLQLQSEGVKTTITSGGEINSNLYNITLHLNNFMSYSVCVASYPNTVSNADIVIGMDIIGQGDFAITNMNGRTVFSFRAPSQEEIRFSEDNITDDSIDELASFLST